MKPALMGALVGVSQPYEEKIMVGLRKLIKGASLALALTLTLNSHAAEVFCGDASLGIRLAKVDPGLVGGYCHAQNGNLQQADIDALGFNVIEWDETSQAGSGTTGQLLYTRDGKEYGTWSFSAALWNSWDRLFLAFHFGGGGTESESNPDSFIVELADPDAAGTWALTGPGSEKLNGLSNIYLLSLGECTRDCNPPEVPEPGMLAMLGLGLLGLTLVRRRRS